MFPGLPTPLVGDCMIETDFDEECQARLVTHHGEPYGCWLDDTTPDLDKWVKLAVAKYRPLHQTVFVCVPPGRPRLRHHPSPPIVNVQEWYPFGMGCPPEDWGPPPKRIAYCIQRRYPGTHGHAPPTEEQYRRLLEAVQANDPKYIFEF